MRRLLLAALLLPACGSESVEPVPYVGPERLCGAALINISSLSDEDAALFSEAMDWWNDRFSAPMFDLGESIPVLYRTSDENTLSAWAQVNRHADDAGCIVGVVVSVFDILQNQDAGLKLNVFKHELGHVLGLSHAESGLMAALAGRHPLDLDANSASIVAFLYPNTWTGP